jgi:hypothetical protein
LAGVGIGAAQAQAGFVTVNLAGFQSSGSSGSASNSQVSVAIELGATVTGWDFENLTFSTSGESFLNEFVISVNNSAGTQYMDALPSDTASGGTFGPASGSWGSAAGGSEGALFAVADGILLVTVYELFVDPGINATVDAGTLRINFTSPIPEPATYGLMALGLLGIATAARRGRRG